MEFDERREVETKTKLNQPKIQGKFYKVAKKCIQKGGSLVIAEAIPAFRHFGFYPGYFWHESEFVLGEVFGTMDS